MGGGGNDIETSVVISWIKRVVVVDVSISPTFYKQLCRMKVFPAAFLYIHFRFVLFWRKEIYAKVARKMLVKLTGSRSRSFERHNEMFDGSFHSS